jgi:hypothetical protein
MEQYTLLRMESLQLSRAMLIRLRQVVRRPAFLNAGGVVHCVMKVGSRTHAWSRYGAATPHVNTIAMECSGEFSLIVGGVT